MWKYVAWNFEQNQSLFPQQILAGIKFSAMPGNVYDFKLYESNQLIWDYAIITEPAIPEYIKITELSPGIFENQFLSPLLEIY